MRIETEGRNFQKEGTVLSRQSCWTGMPVSPSSRHQRLPASQSQLRLRKDKAPLPLPSFLLRPATKRPTQSTTQRPLQIESSRRCGSGILSAPTATSFPGASRQSSGLRIPKGELCRSPPARFPLLAPLASPRAAADAATACSSDGAWTSKNRQELEMGRWWGRVRWCPTNSSGSRG